MDVEQQPWAEWIPALVRTAAPALGVDGGVRTVESERLGMGQTHVNWLVTVNRTHRFTLRAGLRPDQESNLAHEFEILAQVPAGLGPQPFYLDRTKALVPYPYALLSYVEGAPVVDWTPELLVTHARQLARLHEETAARAVAAGTAWTGGMDLMDHVHTALAYWRDNHPDLLEIREVAQLLPRLEAYFQDHAPLFAALPVLPLIHGDAVVSNILVSDGGAVRYIDWEWAAHGDGAQDVAYLGCDVDNPPWQIQLVGERLELYLDAYLQVRPDPTLRTRREVWVTYFKFFDHLHFRTKAAQNLSAAWDLPPAHYAAAAERLARSLQTQF